MPLCIKYVLEFHQLINVHVQYASNDKQLLSRKYATKSIGIRTGPFKFLICIMQLPVDFCNLLRTPHAHCQICKVERTLLAIAGRE